MRPAYFIFVSASLPNTMEKSVMTLSMAFTVFQSVLVVSALWLSGAWVAAQADPTPIDSVTTQALLTDKNYHKPSDKLPLIGVNNNEGSIKEDRANHSLQVADMLEVADQTDDSIDSVPDKSALNNDVIDVDTDIPEDVAQVSLNAISPVTLKTFVQVVDLIRREYVEPVNDEALFDNAMSGMLTKLDSHAEFLNAEAYDNLRAFTEGDVGDIGINAEYQPQAGYWVITKVVDDSPADKKGLAVGDYLHQIDEFKLDANMQEHDVEQRLTGIAGTQVNIVVSKAGRRKHNLTLQRNNNHPQVIETKLMDGVAIIRLPAFQNNSRTRLLDSLVNLDAPVSGILLDVRDNPGGVLTSAVNIASLFMRNTDVVQIKSRQNGTHTLRTKGAAILQSLPVMILQNRYSASAAEVLASSLQVQKRATVVGEVSYGKGSVQSVIPLDDEQAIKLTVANYLTAKGNKIDGIGIKPDIALFGNESRWERQAVDLLRQKIHSPGIRFVHKLPLPANDSK